MKALSVLIPIAVRNIFSSFLNVVIGLIILVGTLLVVVGGSLLNSMDAAMNRSVTGSVSGDLQVYNASSKDELALFGTFGGFPDLKPIPDFSAIKGPLLGLDNVKAVVPMGIQGTFVNYGNTMDQVLEKLRKAVGQRRRGDHSAALTAQIESSKAHVRQMVDVLGNDFKKLTVLAAREAIDPANTQALAKASSAAFWAGFDADPLGHLEFLENRIAPLLPDSDMIFLSYIGTDLPAFARSFDRMQIVDGQKVPEGRRGMLLSKYVYEQNFKLKSAHRLDQIQEAMRNSGKKIAKDPDLRELVKENRTQTGDIVLQLDGLGTAAMVSRLQGFLKSGEKDLAKLLNSFFDTDDSNFDARYAFFYSQMAPLLQLYRLYPGDILTLKAYTRTGSQRAVNMKVYGTFEFKGMEKSGLAGAFSLMDLMSFRDLYGYLTADNLAEIKRIQKAAGASIIDRDKAEAELFGAPAGPAQASEASINDKAELGGLAGKSRGQADQVIRQADLEKGVVLNAAIFLKDPGKLAATQKAIQALSDKDKLGLKVVTWQKSAGFWGQFILVAKAALFAAVAIIFVVAMVIINNAVMMATLHRTQEIGTLRAIGAQRGFVMSMIVVESAALGLAFGGVGMLLGGGIMKWLGHTGIPAPNDFMNFFFSGPRLFPVLTFGNLLVALILILVVTTVSTLYPAILATRVSPLRAMQSED